VTDVQDKEDITSEELFGDKTQALQKAKEAIAGPVPLIPEAPDNKLILPLGLYINGVHKTEITVRELTGLDEEVLAKQKEPTDFFDTVIALGVVSADDFDMASRPLSERQALLRTLLVGERDQLFVAVTRVTFGDDRDVGFTCGACDEQQEMTLLLSEDFKPKEVEDLTLETWTYTTAKGDVLTYRLVTGDDQREAINRKGASLAEQNSTILNNVIVKLNGGLLTDPMSYVRSMTMKDRSTLLNLLVAKQPSIDLEVTTNCAVCGNPTRVSLGWGDLFRN
jgi:hypothetical protein